MRFEHFSLLYYSTGVHRLAQMSDVVMPGCAPYRGWGNADYPAGILLAHDAILRNFQPNYQ